MLARRPGFSLAVVAIFALGIAANVAIFSVFNGLFLGALPFPEPNRLLYLNESAPQWNFPKDVGIAYPDFVPALDAAALNAIGQRYVALVRKQIGRNGEGRERVTDKMPSNYYFAGLIHLALPNAKIIHTMRDPVDTCVSCFSKLFSAEQNHTYDLGELGRYHKRYQRLMDHWRGVLPAGRILDVRYEDVVADLEKEAQRIIAYCGLPWDKRCLSFHETNRPIRDRKSVV